MPVRGQEHGCIHDRRHEHTPRRQFLECSDQFLRRLRFLTVATCVDVTVIHNPKVKCVTSPKGSFLEELTRALVLPQGFERVVQA